MTGERWIILRTAGRHTLRLTESLAEDGFGVWTPVEVSVEKKREVRKAMLPGFIFADASRLFDLLELAAMPVKPRRGPCLSKPAHRPFGVFHYLDRIPLIDDCHLNPLRRIARRRTAQAAAAPLKKYQTVRAGIGTGSFQGMVGRVEKSNERFTIVCFGKGPFGTVEIPTSLLTAEDVNALRSATQSAARKAA